MTEPSIPGFTRAENYGPESVLMDSIYPGRLMKRNRTSAISLLARTMGLALMGVFCLGLPAHAQDGVINLPGNLKGLLRKPGAVPSDSSTNPSAPGIPSATGNASDPGAGTGAAPAAGGEAGTFSFAGKKTITGTFLRNPGNETYKSVVYGKFWSTGANDTFQIVAWDDQYNKAELIIEASIAALSKAPRTYPLEGRKGATSPITFQANTACRANGGTLTLTTFDKAGASGTLSDLKWFQPGCAEQLGTSASFKVQRAADN